MAELTIRGLVEMAYETARANGWHDRQGEVVTPDHPVAKLAALADLLRYLGAVIEAIRQPDRDVDIALYDLAEEAQGLAGGGLGIAVGFLADRLGESGRPIDGSRVQVLSWLVLLVSEVAEAVYAVLRSDRQNLQEELADIAIRLGDMVGAINAMAQHPLGPIDLERAIIEKDQRNRRRGYRHGGKLA